MKEHEFNIRFLEEEFPASYIKDPAKMHVALHALSEAKLIGIDTETAATPKYAHLSDAALDPHKSEIRLLQLFDGKKVYIFDLKYLNGGFGSYIVKFLETKKFIGHFSKFDLKFFLKLGVKSMDIGCSYILTKLLFHAVYPSDAHLKASLDAVVRILFKQDILKKLQASDWANEDLTFEQIEYAGLDAICTFKVAMKLASVITKYDLKRIYSLTKRAQLPLAQMELNGIGFNTEKHREQIATWRGELWEAKKEVMALTGCTKLTSHTIAEWLEQNLPEDTLYIWPRTDTGKLSTDSHAFADFNYLPIVKPFEAYQKKLKLCTSFGNSLIEMINPVTGRLHTSYWLGGARTGRLSSSKPNLQQLPRDGDIRSTFIAAPGNVFLCADYSQIELRVAAELSQDKAMLEAYRTGIDLHALTAAKISKKGVADVTKEERQAGKAFNFGLLFGIGSKKFIHYAKKSYGVDVSESESREAIKIFRSTYSGYRDWQTIQAEEAGKCLEVRTPCGKLRRLDADNTYGTSMNTPVQGGAAECMLYAISLFQEWINANNSAAKLVNCVHDEILVECSPEDKDIVSKALKDSMIQGFLEVFPKGVTNGIVDKVGVGLNWAEAK